ncbi:MAG TPA: long-chain fatty acid--CoA ligase [Puia sp.]|nr:long-chain fatty acid--CoA ligase [Puia sp.]
MRGLMMDYQLTLPTLLRRAESLFAHKEIVTRLPDRSIHRCTYGELAVRVKKLAAALHRLGVRQGDRVATLSWNHSQHLEAYFAVPCMGAVLHPLNIRFSADDLSYIVNHAEDKVLIVDQVLLPLFEQFKDRVNPSRVIVIPQAGTDAGFGAGSGGRAWTDAGFGAGSGFGESRVAAGYLDYEDVVASGDASLFEPFEADEYAAAFLCYTSGTTGRPKGVLYSHRSILLHSMTSLFSCCGIGVTETDVVLPIVPMFHAGAWGFPYNCTLAGATQVFPGPYLDAESLLELFEGERVTVTAAVPTVLRNILVALDADPQKYGLCLRVFLVGGSGVSRHLVASFADRYGIRVVSSWGMTEMSPTGSTAVVSSRLQKASKEEQLDYAIKPGLPAPFVEIRARDEHGFIPWDGVRTGELEVRGPWVCSSYYRGAESDGRFTSDGWLRTGDIVSITEDGWIDIKDRSKDVIKSGGEWISSIALENALMGHPSVHEAAVIAIPDPKWVERPFAYVVPKAGMAVSPAELQAFLRGQFAKFWMPDGYAIVDAIPKTSVGKFLKSALRAQYINEHPPRD